jgi:L-lactate dehydrogenase complex protein LldF
MGSTAEEFLVDSEQKAFDVDHRRIINHNIDKYDNAVEKGLARILKRRAMPSSGR